MKKFALAILLATLLAAVFAGFYRHHTQMPQPAPVAKTAAQAPFQLKLSTRLSAPGENLRPQAPAGPAQPPLDTRRALLIGMAFLAAATLLGVGAGWLLTPGSPALRAAPQGSQDAAATRDDGREARLADLRDAQEGLADGNRQIEELRHKLAESEAGGIETSDRFAESEKLVAVLQAELDEIRDDLQNARQHAERDSARLTESEAVIESLRAELADLVTERQLAEEARERLDSSEREVLARDARIEEIRADMLRIENDTRADAEQFDRRLRERDAAINERDETIEELQQEIADLQRELDASRHSGKEATRLCGEYRAGLEQAGASSNNLQGDLERSGAHIEDLEARLRERDAEVERLNAECRDSDDRAAGIQGALDAANERYVATEASLAQTLEQSAELQALVEQERAASRTLEAAADERDARIHGLEDELGASVLEARELAGFRDKLDAWRSTVRTFESDLRTRDERIAALETRLAELRELQESHLALHDAFTAERTRADENAAAIAALESDLAGERQSGTQLQSRIARLDGQNQGLKGKLATQIDEGARLRERVAQLNVDLYATELSNQDQSGDLLTLFQTAERDGDTIRRLEDEIEAWQDRLPPMETVRHQLTQTVAALRDDLDSVLHRDAETRTEADDLRRLLGEKDSLAEVREQRIAELSIGLETERETILELNTKVRDLDSARTQLAEWRSTIDTFRGEVRRKTVQIDELNDALDALRTENRALREETARVAELEGELEKKTILARALKDGADSMRGYKVTAEQQAGQLDELGQSVSELQRAMNEAEETLAAERALAVDLRERITEQDERVAALNTSLGDKAAEIAALQTAADEAAAALEAERHAEKSALERLAAMENKASDLSQALEEKNRAFTDVEERLDLTRRDFSDLQERADDSKRALLEFQSSLLELDEASGDMGAMLAEPTSAAETHEPTTGADEEVLQDARHDIENAVARLRLRLQEIAEADAAASEMTERLAEEAAANASLLQDLARTRTENDDQRAQIMRHSDVEEELRDVVAHNHAITLEVEELRAQRQRDDSASEAERQRSQELEEMATSALEQNEELEAQLKRERQTVEQFGSDLTELRNAEAQAAERLDALDGIEERAQCLEADVGRLQNDIQERQTAVDAMLAEIGTITHQAVTPSTWRQELAAIMRDIAIKDARIDELARTNLNLRDEIDTSIREHREEQDRLRLALAEREQAMENPGGAGDGNEPEVPVLRDALRSAPPVLRTVVETSDEKDDQVS